MRIQQSVSIYNMREHLFFRRVGRGNTGGGGLFQIYTGDRAVIIKHYSVYQGRGYKLIFFDVCLL